MVKSAFAECPDYDAKAVSHFGYRDLLRIGMRVMRLEINQV